MARWAQRPPICKLRQNRNHPLARSQRNRDASTDRTECAIPTDRIQRVANPAALGGWHCLWFSDRQPEVDALGKPSTVGADTLDDDQRGLAALR